MNIEIDWRVPPVFRPALKPARYIGLRGGRGSGKSHFVGGLVIVKMLEGLNVLCVREIQNSIADSVKRLLEAKISEFGVEHFFEITDKEIRCKLNGAVCIFRGMQTHNAASVKSLEGFDIAWWEEAQTASQSSLDLLIPTIRKPGSQLIFTWNPVKEDDPVEVLLVKEKPETAIVITANWNDNPWFPDVLREDMERDRVRNPDKYAHVWQGKYQSLSEARIFRNWRVAELTVPDRIIWYGGVDFGFANDPTAALRCCMMNDRTLYVDHEAFEVGVPTDALPVFLARVPELHKWPCNADSARPETIDYLNRHGFPRMRGARKGKGSVEDGISFLQGLDIVVHPRCINLTRELGSYAYEIDKRTGQILPVPEDANNHGCIAEGQRILTERGLVPIEGVRIGDMVQTRSGMRRVLDAGVTGRDMDVLRIVTTTGTLVCTPDHRVWTAKGFVRADALRYDDEIIGDASWQSKQLGTGSNTGAGRKPRSTLIGRISSAASRVASSICTALFGKASTALSQPGCKSTIGMGTLRITILPTWNASAQRSMVNGTSGVMSGGKSDCGTWMQSGRWPLLGTAQKKAWPFTANLASWFGKTSSRLKRRADIAESHSCPEKSETLTCIAVTPASQRPVARLALMMKTEFVRVVARHSAQIVSSRPKPVAGRVLTVCAHGKAERVYDLTIEDAHEFFAENVLVHNCDALRYATERLHRRGKLIPVGVILDDDRLKRPTDYRPEAREEESWRTV